MADVLLSYEQVCEKGGYAMAYEKKAMLDRNLTEELERLEDEEGLEFVAITRSTWLRPEGSTTWSDWEWGHIVLLRSKE